MNNAQVGYSSRSMDVAQESARFMSRVYTWMTGGILLTALVASYIASNTEIVVSIILNKPLFYGLLIVEFGAVLVLSFAAQRISAMVATLLYLGYAALNGVTFSVLFLLYTHDSISNVFLLTAAGFAGLSAVGYLTKRDLGPVGTFCTMGLFGIIGFGLLGLFVPSLWSEQTQWVYSVVGVVVFAGLTAYDTQKIKQLGAGGPEGSQAERKAAIFGALTLYLDFINLFLKLLSLTGRRK